jgi:hypothetical protein
LYNAGVYCSKFLSNAWVAKSVDAADSKSAGETRVGSSPTLGTNTYVRSNFQNILNRYFAVS